MIFYFCVSSCNYEQLHYLVSVETHSIMQGCVSFLRAGKKLLMTEMNSRDDEPLKLNTGELIPTLSLELTLASQDSRYSTMVVWPVLVATCRGVLYNCNVCKSTYRYI